MAPPPASVFAEIKVWLFEIIELSLNDALPPTTMTAPPETAAELLLKSHRSK
jgi:hypothetical protein